MGAKNTLQHQEISLGKCGIGEIDDHIQITLPLINEVVINSRALKHSADLFKASVGLSQKKESMIFDTIKFMLICFSASCDGDFSKINLIHSDAFPYIELNKELLKDDYWNIYDNWLNFCTVLKDADILLNKEVDVDEFEKKFNPENLPGWQKAKLLAWCIFNVGKLKKLMNVGEEVRRIRAEIQIKEIPSFISQIFENDLEIVCEAGREAVHEDFHNPEGICDKFWPRLRSVPIMHDEELSHHSHHYNPSNH
ncbi:unnamed protein product [Blepharisma stoltei]|uniref:BTB domain-containing protein n=1 Tax=Blepharisma stoltei TaxID=1481888 RepID=A0AAU9JT60_9CILI|nr:unnamed protein product [Blepharisma stoltei]